MCVGGVFFGGVRGQRKGSFEIKMKRSCKNAVQRTFLNRFRKGNHTSTLEWSFETEIQRMYQNLNFKEPCRATVEGIFKICTEREFEYPI